MASIDVKMTIVSTTYLILIGVYMNISSLFMIFVPTKISWYFTPNLLSFLPIIN